MQKAHIRLPNGNSLELIDQHTNQKHIRFAQSLFYNYQNVAVWGRHKLKWGEQNPPSNIISETIEYLLRDIYSYTLGVMLTPSNQVAVDHLKKMNKYDVVMVTLIGELFSANY